MGTGAFHAYETHLISRGAQPLGLIIFIKIMIGYIEIMIGYGKRKRLLWHHKYESYSINYNHLLLEEQ
jgi:hypothetical protein